LTYTWVDGVCKDFLWEAGDAVRLIGISGKCLGAAMRGSNRHAEAVYYVSQGHKINLDTAIEVVRLCTKRVTEQIDRKRQLEPNDYLPWPIALADATSRSLIELMQVRQRQEHYHDEDDLEEYEREKDSRKRKRTPSFSAKH